MLDWIQFHEVLCRSKPGVVSFRFPTTEMHQRYNFYRTDRFLREAQDMLWHFGWERQHEPLIIGCTANPLALAVQPTGGAPPILDVFTLDKDSVLWHRRFSPPPEGSFATEGLGGCLTVIFDRLFATMGLARFFRRAGWTSLGACESNPAGFSRSSGSIRIAVRRGEEIFLQRFGAGRTGAHWSPDWRPMLGAGWVADPVIVPWGSAETAVFAVTADGELYMYTISGTAWDTEPLGSPLGVETPLGGGFARLPPAVVGQTVFALTQAGQLKYRTFGLDNDWRIFGDSTRRWSTAPVTLFWQRMDTDLFSHTFVFIRDNTPTPHLWASFTVVGSDGWSEWDDLGGAETSEFSVVPESTDRISIYARGRDEGTHLWKAVLPLS